MNGKKLNQIAKEFPKNAIISKSNSKKKRIVQNNYQKGYQMPLVLNNQGVNFINSEQKTLLDQISKMTYRPKMETKQPDKLYDAYVGNSISLPKQNLNMTHRATAAWVQPLPNNQDLQTISSRIGRAQQAQPIPNILASSQNNGVGLHNLDLPSEGLPSYNRGINYQFENKTAGAKKEKRRKRSGEQMLLSNGSILQPVRNRTIA